MTGLDSTETQLPTVELVDERMNSRVRSIWLKPFKADGESCCSAILRASKAKKNREIMIGVKLSKDSVLHGHELTLDRRTH